MKDWANNTPNTSNKIESGILVRLKNSSPKKPRIIMVAATRKANTISSKVKTPTYFIRLVLFLILEVKDFGSVFGLL